MRIDRYNRQCESCGKIGRMRLYLDLDTGMSANSWFFCDQNCLTRWTFEELVKSENFYINEAIKAQTEIFELKSRKRFFIF